MIDRLTAARLEVQFILAFPFHAGAVNGQVRIRLILQDDGRFINAIDD